MNKYSFLFLFFMLILCKHAGSQTIQDSHFPLIDSLLSSLISEANLPGISIAIRKSGKTVYSNGFGFANMAQNQAMHVNTKLRAASVSKVITATALARLVSLEQLDWDDTLSKHLPNLHREYANITIRQLANHTAGMVHRTKKKYKNTAQLLAKSKEALLFKPGTDYSYSSHAFNFLAAVIESVSGVSFETYMSNEIFKPLQMNQTLADKKEYKDDDDASLYYLKDGRLKNERFTSSNHKLAGAGFKTTPHDLTLLLDAYSNGFIKSKVVDEMFSSSQLENGTETQVGIAWRASIDPFGHRLIEHAGNWRGARSVVVHYPDDTLSISLMVNAQCPIFIEETAHLIAYVARNKVDLSEQKLMINKKIRLIDVTKNMTTSEGYLAIKQGIGTLSSKHEGFLKSCKVFQLSSKHYALVSSFGLFYLALDTSLQPIGKLYMYNSRLKASCIENEPSFLIH